MTQWVPGREGKPSLLAAAAAAAAPGMASEARAPWTPGIVNPDQDSLNLSYTSQDIRIWIIRNREGIRLKLCVVVPAACWIAKAGGKACAPAYGEAEMIPGVAAKYKDF